MNTIDLPEYWDDEMADDVGRAWKVYMRDMQKVARMNEVATDRRDKRIARATEAAQKRLVQRQIEHQKQAFSWKGQPNDPD